MCLVERGYSSYYITVIPFVYADYFVSLDPEKLTNYFNGSISHTRGEWDTERC